MKQRILLLGGTGSMGSYLVPELLSRGYAVDVFSLERRFSDCSDLRYFTEDVRDVDNLKRVLENKYDAIVDFLDYPNRDSYLLRHRLFCENTRHYFFLSSYRVYTDMDAVTTETSPRHADVSPDQEFRNSNDYSIYKAKNEDILIASDYENWTIVRPSIIFSRLSFPLVSLGAWSIVNRAREGKPTLIPESSVNVRATATWSGDIAKMFAGIILNPIAYREAYTFATHEHLSWGTFARIYRDILGLETYMVDTDTYKRIYCNNERWGVFQIDYDRLLNRVMDNEKILRAAGLTKSDLMPVEQALERELCSIPRELCFTERSTTNARMDEFFASGAENAVRLL